MVIPDTAAHLDGHTIITHTYSIFFDTGLGNPLIARSKENTLHLELINDPSYLGYITLELPAGKVLYTADGAEELTLNEATEAIQYIMDVRRNPALWNNLT